MLLRALPGRATVESTAPVIVYLFLALVVINGQPQLKGGTHATKAACEAHRAEMLSVLEVRHASRCKPVVLVAEIPRSP